MPGPAREQALARTQQLLGLEQAADAVLAGRGELALRRPGDV